MAKEVTMGVAIVIGVIVLIVVFWGIGTNNKLKVAKLKVQEALSGIDVALTKRFDVLTKMLDVVKEYEKYEKTTILETIKLRGPLTMADRTDADSKMTAISRDIKVVAENYPDLKASENFKTLQEAIVDVEEHLQAARRLYNANATSYNTVVVSFPSSIIANMNGMKEEEYFQADEAKRQDVEMTF